MAEQFAAIFLRLSPYHSQCSIFASYLTEFFACQTLCRAQAHTHTRSRPHLQTAHQPIQTTYHMRGQPQKPCASLSFFSAPEKLSEKLLLFIASFNCVYNSTYGVLCCWTHVINVSEIHTNTNWTECVLCGDERKTEHLLPLLSDKNENQTSIFRGVFRTRLSCDQMT